MSFAKQHVMQTHTQFRVSLKNALTTHFFLCYLTKCAQSDTKLQDLKALVTAWMRADNAIAERQMAHSIIENLQEYKHHCAVEEVCSYFEQNIAKLTFSQSSHL